jgi:hypothetical protein
VRWMTTSYGHADLAHSLQYWTSNTTSNRHTVQINAGLDEVTIRLDLTNLSWSGEHDEHMKIYVRVRAHRRVDGLAGKYSDVKVVQRTGYGTSMNDHVVNNRVNLTDANAIAVERVSVVNVSATSATLRWQYNSTVPQILEVNCSTRANTIGDLQLVCDSQFAPITVYLKSTVHYHKLHSLLAGTKYECRLRPVASRWGQMWSNSVSLRTQPQPPRAVPQRLRIVNDRMSTSYNSGVIVEWQWHCDQLPSRYLVKVKNKFSKHSFRSKCSPVKRVDKRNN